MSFDRVRKYGVVNPPQEFTCESTDIKSVTMRDASGNTIPIPKHSTCWEYNTKIMYIFDGISWRNVYSIITPPVNLLDGNGEELLSGEGNTLQ